MFGTWTLQGLLTTRQIVTDGWNAVLVEIGVFCDLIYADIYITLQNLMFLKRKHIIHFIKSEYFISHL